MQFPFRRTPPAAAWGVRLPQLERRIGLRSAAGSPPRPEPGGVGLTLTTPALPAASAREIATNPTAGENLTPAALVSAILSSEAENRSLRRRLHQRKRELHELKKTMAQQVLEDAELRGRLRTLEEVIAALHANIEDLRLQRDQQPSPR